MIFFYLFSWSLNGVKLCNNDSFFNQNITVEKDQTATFSVEVDANPEARVSWMFKGLPINAEANTEKYKVTALLWLPSLTFKLCLPLISQYQFQFTFFIHFYFSAGECVQKSGYFGCNLRRRRSILSPGIFFNDNFWCEKKENISSSSKKKKVSNSNQTHYWSRGMLFSLILLHKK